MKGIRAAMGFIVTLVVVSLAFGASVSGDIHGVIRNSLGMPVPGANVIVHSMNEASDSTVVSGADGSFLVETLKPGQYQLTANKEGYESWKSTTVESTQQGFTSCSEGRIASTDRRVGPAVCCEIGWRQAVTPPACLAPAPVAAVPTDV